MDHKDLRNILDRVRSKLNDEVLSEVSTDLKAIESGYLEISDSAKVASGEAKERKIKLREKDEELENLRIEVDNWKTKYESYDDSAIKQERDTYKSKYQKFLDTQKSSFQDFFKKASSTDAWKKVSDEYKIPEKDGDEYKWDSLEPDDLETNITKMAYHQKLGLFDAPKDTPNPNTGKRYFDGKPVPTAEEYNEIRTKYGPGSMEARQAMELIQKSKGVR